jgi:hypothetical protein
VLGDFSSIICREGVAVEVNISVSETCVSVIRIDDGGDSNSPKRWVMLQT